VFCRWLLSEEFPEKPTASVTTMANLRAPQVDITS